MDTFSKLILDLYDIAQATDPDDYHDETMRRVRVELGFDSATIGDLRVFGDRLVPVGVHLTNMPTERIRDRQRTMGEEIIMVNGTVKSRDPALRATFGRPGKSLAIDVAASTVDREVLAYGRRYETAHCLTWVSDRLVQNRLSVVSFWRADPRRGFQGEAEHLADRTLPHLLQARQVNARLNAAQALRPATVTVLSSLEGRLYFATDDAIALLQEEWPQWSSPFLPPPLLSALKSRAGLDYAGQRIHVRATMDNAVLTLSLRRQARHSHGLTAAEMRCAVLAAQGLQYKEIAGRLAVSPSTVRNQLSSVYRKLNVRNKTSLVQALDVSGILIN